MAITIVSGERERRGDSYRTRETLSQSTATVFQNVNLFVDSVVLGAGTATGHERNRYRTASGVPEGQEMSFLVTATCEANLFLHPGTATGFWVLTEPDDYILARYENDVWRVIVSSATLASST